MYIIPETAVISVTVVMIVISLVSMLKIRNNLQVCAEKSERIQELTMKIFKFSFIYMMPKGNYPKRKELIEIFNKQ